MIRMMRLHQIHEKLWCARDTVKFCIMISFLRGCLWLGKDVILKCALMVFFILGCTLFSDHVWNWYDEVLQVGKKVKWQYQKIKYCTSLNHTYSRAWKMFIPRHNSYWPIYRSAKLQEPLLHRMKFLPFFTQLLCKQWVILAMMGTFQFSIGSCM